MSRDSDSGWRFRPDIEGMRAVAILLVVGYHAGWRVLRGGFIGVDVFFVLSGFLITGILADEVERSGRVSLAGFWARRARRLLPAAGLVALVTLAVAALWGSPFDQVTYGRTALAVALYASNLFFAREQSDYFGTNLARNPFLHTWSLAVEEQYYLVFAPLTAAVAVLVRRSAPARFRVWFGGLILALTLISLAACLVLVRHRPIAAFYLLPFRAWELGIGAVLAAWALPARVRPGRYLEWLGPLALACLVLSAAVIDRTTSHPGAPTIVPVAATAVLVLTGAAGQGTVTWRLLTSGPMRAIGRLSYSWYLWHWPALVLLREIVPNPPLWLSSSVGVAALGLSALTFAWVERPVRFSPRFSRRSWYSLAGAAGFTVALAAGAIVLKRQATQALHGPGLAPLLAAREALPRLYADGCHADADATTPPRLCAYGAALADTTVILFGDSHAAQWLPALDPVAAARDWRLIPLTKSGCPSAGVILRDVAPYPECGVWRARAIEVIRRLRPALIIVSNWHDYSISDGHRTLAALSPAMANAWEEGMRRTLEELAATGARLVVLRDTPSPHRDLLACLARHPSEQGDCSVPRDAALDTAIADAEAAAAARVPGAAMLDLSDHICKGDRCPAERGGLPVYRDEHHLSVAYATTLAGALDSALSRAQQEASAIPVGSLGATGYGGAPAGATRWRRRPDGTPSRSARPPRSN